MLTIREALARSAGGYRVNVPYVTARGSLADAGALCELIRRARVAGRRAGAWHEGLLGGSASTSNRYSSSASKFGSKLSPQHRDQRFCSPACADKPPAPAAAKSRKSQPSTKQKAEGTSPRLQHQVGPDPAVILRPSQVDMAPLEQCGRRVVRLWLPSCTSRCCHPDVGGDDCRCIGGRQVVPNTALDA